VRWKAGAATIAISQPDKASKTIAPTIRKRRFVRVMGAFWLRCSVGLRLGIVTPRWRERRLNVENRLRHSGWVNVLGFAKAQFCLGYHERGIAYELVEPLQQAVAPFGSLK
jgi:hypothetical protein